MQAWPFRPTHCWNEKNEANLHTNYFKLEIWAVHGLDLWCKRSLCWPLADYGGCSFTLLVQLSWTKTFSCLTAVSQRARRWNVGESCIPHTYTRQYLYSLTVWKNVGKKVFPRSSLDRRRGLVLVSPATTPENKLWIMRSVLFFFFIFFFIGFACWTVLGVLDSEWDDVQIHCYLESIAIWSWEFSTEPWESNLGFPSRVLLVTPSGQ